MRKTWKTQTTKRTNYESNLKANSYNMMKRITIKVETKGVKKDPNINQSKPQSNLDIRTTQNSSNLSKKITL